jgi:hypothetical protein
MMQNGMGKGLGATGGDIDFTKLGYALKLEQEHCSRCGVPMSQCRGHYQALTGLMTNAGPGPLNPSPFKRRGGR